MSHSYTVMWARDYCAALRKAGEAGRPLVVLFGGTHQSAPSLLRAGVSPGDTVFPVSVYQGSLYVLAGAVVREFVALADYAVTHLGLDRESVAGLQEYEIKEEVRQHCSNLGHRAPYGCGTEVALVERSTVLRFDIAVPSDRLSDVSFCPRKGGRLVLKYVRDGKLASALSLHGNVRRLCPDMASLFAELVGLGARHNKKKMKRMRASLSILSKGSLRRLLMRCALR